MGNCSSNQILSAIKKDGKQNVEKASLLSENQKYIKIYATHLQSKYSIELAFKQEFQYGQIKEIENTLKQKYQSKKQQIQTIETGNIQHLQSKHCQSFGALVGYDEALSKLQQFKQRVKQVYKNAKTKLIDDINLYKQRQILKIQKEKPSLAALASLGQKEKQRILTQTATMHLSQILDSNKAISDKFDQKFNFKQIYRKECEQWLPTEELQQIIRNFQKQLQKISPKSKNHYLGCV